MIIDTKEAARRLGLSRMRVVQLLNDGRIQNATKIGGQRGVWIIDADEDSPPVVMGGDRRRRSCRIPPRTF